MTKHQIEVITSVERRRRWSREEKERLVAATFEAGASVSEIARSAGIHGSQLFRWRKELCQISAPSVPQLVPVEVVAAALCVFGIIRVTHRSRHGRRSFHSFGSKRSIARRTASHSSGMDRAATFRRKAFNLANAISIGLKSGE